MMRDKIANSNMFSGKRKNFYCAHKTVVVGICIRMCGGGCVHMLSAQPYIHIVLHYGLISWANWPPYAKRLRSVASLNFTYPAKQQFVWAILGGIRGFWDCGHRAIWRAYSSGTQVAGRAYLLRLSCSPSSSGYRISNACKPSTHVFSRRFACVRVPVFAQQLYMNPHRYPTPQVAWEQNNFQ